MLQDLWAGGALNPFGWLQCLPLFSGRIQDLQRDFQIDIQETLLHDRFRERRVNDFLLTISSLQKANMLTPKNHPASVQTKT